MKTISAALLVSLSLAGIASAQASNDGIVTTRDANVAAQIEQHARSIQTQPAVFEQDAPAAVDHAARKPSHHPSHNRHHHTLAKAKKAHTSVASK